MIFVIEKKKRHRIRTVKSYSNPQTTLLTRENQTSRGIRKSPNLQLRQGVRRIRAKKFAIILQTLEGSAIFSQYRKCRARSQGGKNVSKPASEEKKKKEFEKDDYRAGREGGSLKKKNRSLKKAGD